LLVGDTADTIQRLAIGSNAQVLTVDTTVDGKIKWATPSAGATFVGVLANKTSSQTISNDSETVLTFTAADSFDTDAFHDTSTNTGRLTIPSGKGGYYKIYFVVNWTGGNSTGLRTTQLYKNGSSVTAQSSAASNSGQVASCVLSITQDVSAADYFEIRGYQASGGNLNVNDAFFGMEKIG
jgi:hypothetical protein